MFVTEPQTPRHEVQLTVGGQLHEGWQSVDIEQNLDALSGSFRLTVTRDWVKEGQKQSLKVDAGQECTVAVDGETVITGWLDVLVNNYSNTTHVVTLEGRDKTGDLADCSAPVKDWHGQTLDAIIKDICAPFGIAVQCNVPPGTPFGKFASNPGDTCHATIERLLRQRGLWAFSDGLGNLIIDSPKAATPVSSFGPGKGVEVNSRFDVSERFSHYTVMGHHNPGGEDDEDDSEDPEPRHPEGHAQDAGVKRYRPLIIVAESAGQGATFAERARHEAAVRAAKGTSVTVKAPKWYAENGKIYKHGQTVTCDDSVAEVAGIWLLQTVRLSQTEAGGTTCSLTLADPAAFDRVSLPDKKRKNARKNVKQMNDNAITQRLRNLFCRATTVLTNSKANLQRMQLRLFGNEGADGIEFMEHYGLTSHPPAGLDAAVLFVAGSRDHGVCVAVGDRKFRIRGLKAGEVAIYTDEGDKIELLRDHNVIVTTKHVTVNAEEDYTVNTKKHTVNCETHTVNASEKIGLVTPTLGVESTDGGTTTATFRGDLDQEGWHHSTGDQVAGSVSQKQHTHRDSGGTGPSGPPIGG